MTATTAEMCVCWVCHSHCGLRHIGGASQKKKRFADASNWPQEIMRCGNKDDRTSRSRRSSGSRAQDHRHCSSGFRIATPPLTHTHSRAEDHNNPPQQTHSSPHHSHGFPVGLGSQHLPPLPPPVRSRTEDGKPVHCSPLLQVRDKRLQSRTHQMSQSTRVLCGQKPVIPFLLEPLEVVVGPGGSP